MNQLIVNVDNTLGNFLENYIQKPTTIKGLVHLFLILYAARLAPVPPKQVLELFDNVYFKLACFALILWSAQFSPSTSILIALAFMVSINYSTTGKVWEMMENISESQPVAPSKDIAISAVTDTMNSQTKNTPVVENVSQNENTIVITPTIINTPSGPTVLNPTVVIAPATVSTPSGEIVTVTPDVTTMTTTVSSQQISGPTPTQSIESVKILAQAAASSSASDEKAVIDVAKIAIANVTSQSGSEAITKLVQQSIVAEAGDSQKISDTVVTAVDSISKLQVASGMIADINQEVSQVSQVSNSSGCYPLRTYDMSKISPQVGTATFEDYQIWTPSINA